MDLILLLIIILVIAGIVGGIAIPGHFLFGLLILALIVWLLFGRSRGGVL